MLTRVAACKEARSSTNLTSVRLAGLTACLCAASSFTFCTTCTGTSGASPARTLTAASDPTTVRSADRATQSANYFGNPSRQRFGTVARAHVMLVGTVGPREPCHNIASRRQRPRQIPPHRLGLLSGARRRRQTRFARVATLEAGSGSQPPARKIPSPGHRVAGSQFPRPSSACFKFEC